jgi:YVTN family beta-propeller protein
VCGLAFPQQFQDYRVGPQSDGSVIVPTNQRVTASGLQVDIPGRPLAVAIRPDQKSAAVLTAGSPAPVVIIDLTTGKVKQLFNGVGGSGASYGGLIYSADGKHLYYSENKGKVCIAKVESDGSLTPEAVINIPPPSRDPNNGSLVLSADGKKLYVALNTTNALGIVDLHSNEFVGQVAVGNAPNTVVRDGNLAYVTNEGGRPAKQGDFTALSAGTKIVADPESAASVTGTVSVVDLVNQRVIRDIEVGLHPTAALVHNGYVFVANTNSDSISVINARSQKLVRTVKIQTFPDAPFGDSPNGLAINSRDELMVSLGANNAVAIYRWTRSQESLRFEGLVPTGWYPVSLGIAQPRSTRGTSKAAKAQERLIVANGKGTAVGSNVPDSITGPDPATNRTGKATHTYIGSVSMVDLPNPTRLHFYTQQVASNNGWNKRAVKARPPIVFQQPSPIQHVFYVIKENRTYDQILGDDTRGNGDAALVQFGKSVTPNQHALADGFVLFDNFYDSGVLSADGHQWTDQAFAPDYIEKGFTAFKRSYPFNGGDSLVYTPTGFLWMNALKKGKSVRMYGEYAYKFNGPKEKFGTWSSWYSDSLILEGKKEGSLHVQLGEFQAVSDVPSADKLLNRNFPTFNTAIPDQYRLDIFLRDFEGYVKQNNLPNLVIMTLCADHTSGVKPGFPTPSAQVADNDLAVGRLIDTISHSPYWSSSAIFIVEDDSQNGVDHVDAHRSTAFVVSPYVRRGAVNHTYHTQISMVRTIEDVLGLPPMTQRDFASDAMLDVFQDTPDLTPYTTIPVQIALDTLNQKSRTAMVRRWQNASSKMFPDGPGDRPDTADENVLNRAIWYGTKGFSTPYPGDGRVLFPNEVHAASAKDDDD